jgi:hypothetical protein
VTLTFFQMRTQTSQLMPAAAVNQQPQQQQQQTRQQWTLVRMAPRQQPSRRQLTPTQLSLWRRWRLTPLLALWQTLQMLQTLLLSVLRQWLLSQWLTPQQKQQQQQRARTAAMTAAAGTTAPWRLQQQQQRCPRRQGPWRVLITCMMSLAVCLVSSGTCGACCLARGASHHPSRVPLSA